MSNVFDGIKSGIKYWQVNNRVRQTMKENEREDRLNLRRDNLADDQNDPRVDYTDPTNLDSEDNNLEVSDSRLEDRGYPETTKRIIPRIAELRQQVAPDFERALGGFVKWSFSPILLTFVGDIKTFSQKYLPKVFEQISKSDDAKSVSGGASAESRPAHEQLEGEDRYETSLVKRALTQEMKDMLGRKVEKMVVNLSRAEQDKLRKQVLEKAQDFVNEVFASEVLSQQKELNIAQISDIQAQLYEFTVNFDSFWTVDKEEKEVYRKDEYLEAGGPVMMELNSLKNSFDNPVQAQNQIIAQLVQIKKQIEEMGTALSGRLQKEERTKIEYEIKTLRSKQKELINQNRTVLESIQHLCEVFSNKIIAIPEVKVIVDKRIELDKIDKEKASVEETLKQLQTNLYVDDLVDYWNESGDARTNNENALKAKLVELDQQYATLQSEIDELTKKHVVSDQNLTPEQIKENLIIDVANWLVVQPDKRRLATAQKAVDLLIAQEVGRVKNLNEKFLGNVESENPQSVYHALLDRIEVVSRSAEQRGEIERLQGAVAQIDQNIAKTKSKIEALSKLIIPKEQIEDAGLADHSLAEQMPSLIDDLTMTKGKLTNLEAKKLAYIASIENLENELREVPDLSFDEAKKASEEYLQQLFGKYYYKPVEYNIKAEDEVFESSQASLQKQLLEARAEDRKVDIESVRFVIGEKVSIDTPVRMESMKAIRFDLKLNENLKLILNNNGRQSTYYLSRLDDGVHLYQYTNQGFRDEGIQNAHLENTLQIQGQQNGPVTEFKIYNGYGDEISMAPGQLDGEVSLESYQPNLEKVRASVMSNYKAKNPVSVDYKVDNLAGGEVKLAELFGQNPEFEIQKMLNSTIPFGLSEDVRKEIVEGIANVIVYDLTTQLLQSLPEGRELVLSYVGDDKEVRNLKIDSFELDNGILKARFTKNNGDSDSIEISISFLLNNFVVVERTIENVETEVSPESFASTVDAGVIEKAYADMIADLRVAYANQSAPDAETAVLAIKEAYNRKQAEYNLNPQEQLYMYLDVFNEMTASGEFEVLVAGDDRKIIDFDLIENDRVVAKFEDGQKIEFEYSITDNQLITGMFEDLQFKPTEKLKENLQLSNPGLFVTRGEPAKVVDFPVSTSRTNDQEYA